MWEEDRIASETNMRCNCYPTRPYPFSLKEKLKKKENSFACLLLSHSVFAFHFLHIINFSSNLIPKWAGDRDSSLILARKPKVQISLRSVPFLFSVFLFDFWVYFIFLCLDLLTRDYISDHKFSVSTYSESGVVRCLILFFCSIFSLHVNLYSFLCVIIC